MSEEKSKSQTRFFKAPNAYLAYSLFGHGLVALILFIIGFNLFNEDDPSTHIYGYFLTNWSILLIFGGLIGLAVSLYVVIHVLNFFGQDRNNIVALYIAFVISVIFIFAPSGLKFLDFNTMQNLEDWFLDKRFQLTAPDASLGENLEEQIKNYDAQGISQEKPYPGTHPALEIIGIDNKSIDFYQGFPFTWDKYSTLLKALRGSGVNSIMFDVFFLDERKNNYGLVNCLDTIKRKILAKENVFVNKAFRDRCNHYLSDTIEKTGKVVVDYAFKTEHQEKFESRKLWNKYLEKLKALKQYTLKNTSDPKVLANLEWVSHPDPPMPKVGEVLDGIGFANIRKKQTGINRQMPLVIKWKMNVPKDPATKAVTKEDRKYREELGHGKVALYPSIDMILVSRFYGVPLNKIEVKLGKYVKIPNIPKKTISFFYNLKSHSDIKCLNADAIAKGEEFLCKIDIMFKPNKDRTIVIPIDKEGFMDINFIGGPWSFPSKSFSDVVDNTEVGSYGPDNDTFKDKLLLVAMYYGTGVAKDIHNSPFSETAGIEHHANALNTILRQEFIIKAKWWINAVILLFFGLLFGFMVPRFKMQYVLIISFAIWILFFVEILIVFSIFHYVHTASTAYIMMITLLITIVAYKVLTEEANVKYIRSTFSRFVSKDIVNELLENPNAMKLGGDKKDLTVFFSDIRGFTTISESLAPEELVSLLNDYLSAMTDSIISFKGTIDKYMGDAIMAFWGAPVPNEDHAYLGCLAAVHQLKLLDGLQQKWKEQGRPMIDIGIGLNSGPAVAGNMGSSHRMEYTVMGDTINLGSRLEGTNKFYGTKIIISEYTYATCGDRIVARELDLIKVKGKTEPVRIYELLDIVNEADLKALQVQA